MNNHDDLSKIYCLDCGQAIQPDWKFCPYCKSKQKKAKCIHCGQTVNTYWNYCPFCKIPFKVKTFIENGQKGNDWIRQILESK